MTKTITGSNEAYADNWTGIFKKKTTGKKRAAGKSARKTLKKKTSARR